MSIQSGYKKVKDYILESSGYKLLSRWTSSNTVEFDDGQTAQDKVGAVKGITSSTTATDAGYAASATQMNPNVSGSLAAKVDALDKSMVKNVNSLNLKLDSNYYSKNEQDNRFQPKSTQTTARSAGKWVRTYNGNGYYETDYISDSITFATNVSYGTDYFCDISCNIPSNVRINEISNIQVTLLSGDGIAYASIKDYNSSVVNIRINAPANIVKNYIIMLKIWGS